MLNQLAATAKQAFLSQFRRQPTIVVAAPGRVNLIGEHIDYNDGFVLPMAIDRHVLIVAALSPKSDGLSATIYSENLDQTSVIPLDQILEPETDAGWVNYLKGVIAKFPKPGMTLPTFQAVISSDVPLGGGLSSSAALEVATATLLEALTGVTLDPKQKALLCQSAEHQFAGVPCGIMDQFSSVFGQTDELMLIDCLTQEIEAVPFNSQNITVLITNSNVKHELTGGEYAQRRSECQSALKQLRATSWREVSSQQLESGRSKLSVTEFKRARHVVREIERTRQAAAAFRLSDWARVGELMYASHESLRDDFEVSCEELDVLVGIGRQIGESGGVIGSRMTGGGFGGCTVSLVKNEKVDQVIAELSNQYESRFGFQPSCFTSRPARGAHVIELG